MTISGLLAIFLVGCLGGVLAELAKWYQLRESPNFPVYAQSIMYWIITAAMIVAGGVLAALYGTDPKNAILVANIGVSAPLIVSSLAKANPLDNKKRLAAQRAGPTVWDFLAGR